MNIIGLTGGTGTGKSLVASTFFSLGYPIYDCDAVYHDMVSFYSPCVQELERVFGKEILTENGALNRVELRNIVFADCDAAPQQLETLNHISHQYVKENFFSWCEKMKGQGVTTVVIDAPTLFQANLQNDCVVVIGVLADEEVRMKRIMVRDGLSATVAAQRIRAQLSDDFYRKHCDFIVENNSSADDVRVQTEKIILELRKRGILQ